MDPDNYTLDDLKGYVWYTDTRCVTGEPNLGFIKAATTPYTITNPLFNTALSASETLTNVLNFLYSFMNIEQVRIQAVLLKGYGFDGFYYYHLVIMSESQLSLDFYDGITNPPNFINNGAHILLCGGNMQCATTTIFPNYGSDVWQHSDSTPTYTTGIAKMLEYLIGLIASVKAKLNHSFQEAELAFYDSCDADFGESNVVIDNPEKIISEIFDDSRDVTYMEANYGQVMQNYSPNIYAILSLARNNICPYFPAG